MEQLIPGLIGLAVAVVRLVVLKTRADRHAKARGWIDEADGLGLAHRFSSLADVGSEATGEVGGRAVAVRGPRDDSEPPFVRVHVAFRAPIPLGMELYRPPNEKPLSVHRGLGKLPHPEGTIGWALHAVRTEDAAALVERIAPDLAALRATSDGARIHDGGVMLLRDGPEAASGLRLLLGAARTLADRIEAEAAELGVERPAEPVSWPDLAARHELEIDPDGRRIHGHLRGAFVEAKLGLEGTELRVEIDPDALDTWHWRRGEGLVGQDVPTGVERALTDLPAGVQEVSVVDRWIEACCDALDAGALSATLHRVLQARDALLGRTEVYR
ncbi:MAG: hypothetical protein R3B82_03145 [Sandaracinaceae bacterium]